MTRADLNEWCAIGFVPFSVYAGILSVGLIRHALKLRIHAGAALFSLGIPSCLLLLGGGLWYVRVHTQNPWRDWPIIVIGSVLAGVGGKHQARKIYEENSNANPLR